VTDTIAAKALRARKRRARLAYGMLLVLWVLIFGVLGYSLGNEELVVRVVGINWNGIVGSLVLLAVVTGVLALAAGRNR
jgi:hypothetical protein